MAHRRKKLVLKLAAALGFVFRTQQFLVRGFQAPVRFLYLSRPLINFGFHLLRVCSQFFPQFFLLQCLLLEPNELRHVLDTMDNVDDLFTRPKNRRVDGAQEPSFNSPSSRSCLPITLLLAALRSGPLSL